MLRQSRVGDVPFDVVTPSEASEQIGEMLELGQPRYVITANLKWAMRHSDRTEMRPITEAADLILVEGPPIVWRSRLTSNPLPARVAGSELIYELAELSSRKCWGIYFLGGEPGVAATCAERLSDRYPGMLVAGVEPSQFQRFSEESRPSRMSESGVPTRRSCSSLLVNEKVSSGSSITTCSSGYPSVFNRERPSISLLEPQITHRRFGKASGRNGFTGCSVIRNVWCCGTRPAPHSWLALLPRIGSFWSRAVAWANGLSNRPSRRWIAGEAESHWRTESQGQPRLSASYQA